MSSTTGYVKKYRVCEMENPDPRMFGDMFLSYQTMPSSKTTMNLNDIGPLRIVQNIRHRRYKSDGYCGNNCESNDDKKRRASLLMDQLLIEIYGTSTNNNYTDYNSATSSKSQKIFVYEKYELERKSTFIIFL